MAPFSLTFVSLYASSFFILNDVITITFLIEKKRLFFLLIVIKNLKFNDVTIFSELFFQLIKDFYHFIILFKN